MKRILLIITLFIACCLSSSKVLATHVLGADISYKWIADSTYRITLVVYGNCSSDKYTGKIPSFLTGTPEVHIFDSTIQKYPSNPIVLLMNPLLDSNRDVSPYCPAANDSNSCVLYGYPYAGIYRYVYTNTITLPHKSRGWVIEFVTLDKNCNNAAGRSVCNNFHTDGHDNIIVMNTLNNMNGIHNSTPPYTSAQYANVFSLNVPSTFQENTPDPDNDSLVYYTDSLYEETDGNCYAPPGILLWQPGFQTSNPVGAASLPGTYNFSNSTGNMAFTPSTIGSYAVTTRIVEYRGGVIVGSTLRELTFFFLAYSGGTVKSNIDSSSLTGANFIGLDTITACPGNTIAFTSPIKDNHGDILQVSLTDSIPGSTVVITGNNTANPSLSFNWNTTGAHTNNYKVTASFFINSCPLPSYSSHSYVIIFNNLTLTPDTIICQNSTAPLHVSGGANYTWSVIPGGSPLSTLSCTTCADPIASPTLTTRYVVTATQPNGCTLRDTVKVTVNPIPAKPLPTSNGPLCANTSLTLFAGTTASTYIWSGPGGFNSALQNPVVANIQLPNTGWYHVSAKNGNCVSPADSVYVVVDAAPKFPTITGISAICSGGTISLFAQSSPNANYLWTGPANYSSASQNMVINNAGVQYAGNYTVVASSGANGACTSAPATYTVTVKAGIFADFHFSKDSICQFDQVAITYNSGGVDSLLWNFDGGVLLDTLANNPIHVSFPHAGTQTVTLTAADTACTDVVSRPIHVFNAPVSTFTAPAVTCFGNAISVIANNEYNQDVLFSWSFPQATVLNGGGQGPYELQYTTPGTYYVTLVTQNTNCTSKPTTDTLLVDAIPDASITTPDINNICSDDSVHFDGVAVEGSHYRWIQSRIFDNDTLPTTFALVRSEGNIYLYVTDKYGCKASDSLYFQPHPCCLVSFPNAFTPNGDSRNDVFRPITNGHHDIAYFRVFNRWGQMVYSSREEQTGWDGTYNGVPADMGVYYFAIKYRCVDGEYFEEKGEVMLIR